jgi:hypothetical protein
MIWIHRLFSLPIRAWAVPLAMALGLGAARALAAPASAASAPSIPASGAPALSAADESKQIARERAAAQASFLARERECREHFVVTPCLDKAKSDRRQVLDQLRARQLVIDEARRHQRSAERKAELLEKAAEDARRESVRAAHAAAATASAPASQPESGEPPKLPRPAAAASAARAPHEHGHASGSGLGVKPRPRESQSAREQHEAASRAAFDARQAEAATHRKEAMDRIRKRTGQTPAAAPLPVPGAPSAAPPASSSRP